MSTMQLRPSSRKTDGQVRHTPAASGARVRSLLGLHSNTVGRYGQVGGSESGSGDSDSGNDNNDDDDSDDSDDSSSGIATRVAITPLKRRAQNDDHVTGTGVRLRSSRALGPSFQNALTRTPLRGRASTNTTAAQQRQHQEHEHEHEHEHEQDNQPVLLQPPVSALRSRLVTLSRVLANKATTSLHQGIEGDSSSEEQDQQMPVTPMNNAIHGPASSRRANTTTTNVSRMIDHVSAMKRLRRTPAIHNTAALPSPGFRLNRPISNIRSTINKGRRNLFRNSDQGLLQQLARINQSADGVSNQLIPTPFRNITATDSVTGNSMNREQPSTPLNEVEGGRDISNIQADSVRSNSGFNYQSTPGATTRNGDNSNNNNDSNYTNYNNTPSMMWTNQSAQSINDKSRISLLDSFGNSFDNSFDVNDMGFNTHAEHSILGNTMDSFSWTPTLKLDSDMNNDQSLFSTRQSLGNQSIFNNQSMFSPMLPQINSAVNGTDDNIENSNENNNDNSSNSVNENENDITDEPSFIIQASSYPEEGMDVQKDINANNNIDYSYNETSSLHQQANVHLPPPLTLFNYDDDNNHSRNVTKSRRLRIPLSSIGLNRQQQSNPIAESAARPRQNRQSAKSAAYRVLRPSQTRSLFESFSTLAGSTLTESGLKSLENVTHEFIQYAGSELVNIMDKSSKRHSRTLTALPEHVYRLMSQQGLLSGNESSDIKSLAIQEAARVLPRELLNELDPVARIADEDLSR